MSIINEALKKTQQIRKLDMDKRASAKEKISAESQPMQERASLFETPLLKEGVSAMKKLDYLLSWKKGSLLTTTVLLSVIAFMSYQHARKINAPVVQTALNVSKEKMAFTGIFVSDNSKIAVINKQSYHLGDMVNGMKIMSINQDSVDLMRDGKLIQIRAGATYLL